MYALETSAETPEKIYSCLTDLVRQLQKAESTILQDNSFAAYLHGQIYGITMCLQLLYPGADNWGEKAALLIRPLLSEQVCDCPEAE